MAGPGCFADENKRVDAVGGLGSAGGLRHVADGDRRVDGWHLIY